MAKVLSGYRGLGKQISAGVFRDSNGSAGSFVGGVPMAQSATKSNGSDPQGVEFFIAVKMADQTIEANRPHFEYMIASYDLTSSVYTWNRVSTIDSSNGGAAVDWESITTDENSLTFYAITPHSAFSNKTINSGSNYVVVAAGASGDVCDDIIITPTNSYSNLLIDGYIHYYAAATSATNYARPRYFVQYKNSSGVWNNLMADYVGTRAASYSSQSAFGYVSFLEELNNTTHMHGGNWNLRFRCESTGAATTTNRIKFTSEQVS